MTSVILLLTISGLVLCLESPLGQRANGITTIRAQVVAYDLGVEQANSFCRQLVIGRSDKSANRYLIARSRTVPPPGQAPQPAHREDDREKRGPAKRDKRPDEEELSTRVGDSATDKSRPPHVGHRD